MNELKKRLSNPVDLVIVLLGIILIVLVCYYLYKQHFSENFQETPNGKSNEETEYLILLYHASWCPHCTTFLPEWKNLGNKIPIPGSNVIVLEEDERDDRLLGEARHFNHSQPTTIDDPFEMVAAHQLYVRTKDNLKANWAQTFDEHLGMSKVKTTKSRKLNWLHRDKIKSEMNRVMS